MRGAVAVPPALMALHFSGFGSKRSARKVAMKSLELELLGGSALEGCFYFIIFSLLQMTAWKREGRLLWAVPPKVI